MNNTTDKDNESKKTVSADLKATFEGALDEYSTLSTEVLNVQKKLTENLLNIQETNLNAENFPLAQSLFGFARKQNELAFDTLQSTQKTALTFTKSWLSFWM